ncbi:MAG: MFS transporter [Pseudomonadota bacterium]
MQEIEHLKEAKRTTLTLAAAQSLIGSTQPICISIGGLAGFYLLGTDKALATLPVTGFNLGVAIGALPAAMLMRAIGRRYGFSVGALIVSLGAALAALALLIHNFWFFAFGLAVIGIGGSFQQQYRFAAADASPKSFKSQSISWVLCGGIVAAIIGPQLVILTKDLMAPVSYAGAFLSAVVLGVVGAGVLMTLKPQPATVDDPEDPTDDERPLSSIISQPRFLVSFLCAVVTYALMAFVMTGAPLAMVACGHSADDATLGISWHVLAMFGPSFFTGKLIARFGKETIVAAGLLLLIGSGIVALSGLALWQFWIALILLGVGWNFGFIGATAMTTDTYRPSEKNKVQGIHDFALFTFVAIGSLASGATLNAFGWDMINWIVFPAAGFCLVVLAIQAAADRRAIAAAE